MQCRGLCNRFRAKKSSNCLSYYRDLKAKRCSNCNLFIVVCNNDFRCPCCFHLLRAKPSNNRHVGVTYYD